MNEMVDWFREASWPIIAVIGVAMNLSITATSMAVWTLLSDNRPTRSDLSWKAVASAAVTTVINGVVLVPAWWLWQRGTLELPNPTVLSTVLPFIYLTVFMDTALYWIHRAGHHDLIYHFVHRRHHEEQRMTQLSLFVMHPIEAAGFGLLMITALLLVPVSVLAIAAFGTLNVMAGTLAHLSTAGLDRDSSPVKRLGGWADFHQAHHADPSVNFGFFVPIWDRVAGTVADG